MGKRGFKGRGRGGRGGRGGFVPNYSVSDFGDDFTGVCSCYAGSR